MLIKLFCNKAQLEGEKQGTRKHLQGNRERYNLQEESALEIVMVKIFKAKGWKNAL